MATGVVRERYGRIDVGRTVTALRRVAGRGVRTLRRAAGTLLRGREWRRSTDARAAFRAGRALDRSGRRRAAADAYRRAIALDPTHAHWHFRLGRALDQTRQWSAAADAYRTAIDHDPTRPGWHFRLGRTLERARDWAGAAEAYEAALELDDSRPVWHERHAAALRRARDHEGHDRAVALMLRREPDMPALHRRLLHADPRRFNVRRRLLAFVTDHLDEIDDVAGVTLPASTHPPDRIWLYWGQGTHDLPDVVRRCRTEVLRHHGDGVVLLDDTTVDEHSELPGVVRDRTRRDHTKFSDALRLDLLARHGGVWLDATVLPRRNLAAMLPELLPSGFFALRYRHARVSSWLLASTPGDPTMATLRAAQIVYWRHHDRPIDYFVLHHLFEALVHVHPGVGAAVGATPKVSSHPASRFARAMFEPYDRHKYRRLLDGAFVHKLSHKLPPDRDLRGTMLARLLEHGPPRER